MNKITFYEEHKHYHPMRIKTPDERSDLMLFRDDQKLSFSVYTNEARSISCPIILLCGKQVLVRMKQAIIILPLQFIVLN